MYCPNCGNDIPSTENKCDNCNCVVNEKRKYNTLIEKIKGSKKLASIVAVIVAISALVICFSSVGVESQAKKYIRETQKLEDVQKINGVVCIAKKYVNDDDYTYGYVVLYTTRYGSDFAYYEKNIYKGNGKNGGDANKYEDKTFYNMHALSAIKKAIEYIQKENQTILSCEKHIDADEGVVYIKLDDFPNWINNQ